MAKQFKDFSFNGKNFSNLKTSYISVTFDTNTDVNLGMKGGENIVEIKGIKQLTDAVYDKAKEMNHPIRKHETYWAMKAFMEIMVDVIKEDGYLRIYDIFILERKWKNAKTYGNFGRGVVRKEGRYVPSIRFGKRMNRVAQEKADEGEEEVE